MRIKLLDKPKVADVIELLKSYPQDAKIVTTACYADGTAEDVFALGLVYDEEANTLLLGS